jgi:hypothetical protein
MAEKGTMSISELVEQAHGLPLSFRTPEEVDEDYRNELEFTRSLGRSLVRREPKRFESEIIIDILDDISDELEERAKKLVNTSTQHLHFINHAERQNASQF